MAKVKNRKGLSGPSNIRWALVRNEIGVVRFAVLERHSNSLIKDWYLGYHLSL